MIKRFFKKKIVRQIINIVIAVIISLSSLFGIYKGYTSIKNKILMSILLTTLIVVLLFALIFMTYVLYDLINSLILSNRNKKCLSILKMNLSTEFKFVYFKGNNYPEITSFIMDSDSVSLKAKLEENDEIHLIIENAYGIVYDANTTNYKWFLENFSFTETKKDSLI